jgi:hypothetical protein
MLQVQQPEHHKKNLLKQRRDRHKRHQSGQQRAIHKKSWQKQPEESRYKHCLTNKKKVQPFPGCLMGLQP